MAKGSGYTPLVRTVFVPDAMSGRTKAAKRRILKEAGAALVAAVYRATPVDTGALRQGTRAVADVATSSVKLVNNLAYALPVEEGHATAGGHGYVSGQHFMAKGIAAANVRAQKAAARQAKAEGRKRRG